MKFLADNLGEILIPVIGTLITIILPIIITFIVNRQLTKFTTKQDRKREKEVADLAELEARRKKEERESLKQDMTIIVHDAVSPVIEEVGALKKDVAVLKEGTQAVLRNDLIQIADEWLPKGYCPLHVRQTFENTYSKYHNLGENGVMNGIRKQLLDLPLSLPEPKLPKTSRTRKTDPELVTTKSTKITLNG